MEKAKKLDYDILECPECEKPCKPVKELKNGTVVYETHECENSDEHSFSIDVEGNLVE